MAEPYLVMWRVPRPTLLEARERLELIGRDGPTTAHFTFRRLFPPPDAVNEGTPLELNHDARQEVTGGSEAEPDNAMTNTGAGRPEASLCPELAALLSAELRAGNSIREVGPAPGTDGILVLLSRAMLALPATLPDDVHAVPVNDPHWWKSEYRCRLHPDVLACAFE